VDLEIETPRHLLPLIGPKRYKGLKGGRGSGKSHFFAELVVEKMILDPHHNVVCIREIQKSLKFSAKKLVEDKIREFNASSYFDITLTEIRRIGGTGVMIFQGMQDHTADSIKSLEGFDTAWVEEAQSISARSLELLLPTIRAEGSEILFSWNPNKETDPVEKLFKDEDKNAICIHINYTQNKRIPQTLLDEAERHIRVNPDSFSHVWLGAFNTISDLLIFNGKYRVGEIDVSGLDNPLFGADWGFAQDPTTLTKSWVIGNTLYIEEEVGGVGVELDETAQLFDKIKGSRNHVIRADSARPETISHIRNKGFDRITSVQKWSGSVEDGINFMRSFDEIVINPSCKNTIVEFQNYSYKQDRVSGDILPVIVDKYNHYIDSIRYALTPLIKRQGFFVVSG
jgi:phage terminase large subunit